MKLLQCFLLLPLLFTAPASFAQMTADPTEWKYEIKKKSATEYVLVFHVALKSGWHIYSLSPGGDGYEIAPSFTFDKNDKVKFEGKVSEKGKMTTTAVPGIDGKINYMTGTVDYMQEITAKAPAKVTGTHRYQVCNDQICLPPVDKNFVFEIK